MAFNGTIISSASSVSAARTNQTSVVSISARPQITFFYPSVSLSAIGYVGYTTDYTFYGYNFDTTTAVYVSAAGAMYTTTALSAVKP